ncbi:hypothetical protein LWI29_027161 [Acer saccharum]|uniref:Uncharacterized protein n=1 Tax=Acer saccharum TaxID=4024 RepID=A0AA39TX19_ACESA|nr:hypothetical protein LWI29_027161 [Acer saccharum]
MRKHKAILKETTTDLRTKQRKLSKVWEDYTKCKGSMIDQELLNYLDGVRMINNSKHGFTSVKSIMKVDHLLHVYKQEKEKLSKYLSDLSCLFTLTIDRVQKHSHVYFCLTVHFIEDDWELKNKILNFTCPNRPSLDTFKSLLLDWNIDKIVRCTMALDHNIIIDDTDNSLPFRGRQTLLQVGCFVHFFHAFNFGANFTFGVLKKLWRCCDYVHQNQIMTSSSSNNEQDFQSSLGQILMTTSKGSVLTKSISDLKCLEAALEFEGSFCALEQLNPHFKSINLTREEWGEATAIYEFLKSLNNVVCYFSLDQYPTTNLYFPKVCDIHKKKLHSWEKSDYWDLREVASCYDTTSVILVYRIYTPTIFLYLLPTSSSSSKSSLPGPTIANFLKLSETNYLLWIAQLRPFLIGHGMYQYVDGTMPAPPPTLPATNSATADPNPTYLHWFQQDQLVVSYLVATMTEPMLSLIVGKSTALEMWLCLKDNFSQQSVANTANTRFHLMDMTKGTKSISAYLQHAKSLSDSLAAIYEPISSTDLVTAVLRGFGSDYAMIVIAILNFPPLPRFEDLRARLLSFESQLLCTKPTDSSSTTALAATQSISPTTNITHGPSYGRGQSCGNGRNGRRGNSRGRGCAPWHSTFDYSGYGSGRGYYWPPQTGSCGLLGAHLSQALQWCSTCSTSQHFHSHYPHHYHGPESLIAPFAGMHVAQYLPPPDFTWYPDTECYSPYDEFCSSRFCPIYYIQVLHDPSQLATLELYQLNTPPAAIDIPPLDSVGLTEQHSPPCPTLAPAILDLVVSPIPHDIFPVGPCCCTSTITLADSTACSTVA